MNAYILVEMAKHKQNISSDRAFAIKNGLSTQNIVDWKAGKSLPGWERLEILATAAGIELWEAVKVMKETSITQQAKQAGFASIQMMFGLLISSLMLLTAVTQSAALPSLATVFGVMTVYYVK